MKCLTYIYSHNKQTKRFLQSAERHGVEVINTCQTPGSFGGNNVVLQRLWATMNEFKGTNEYILYADGGDSLFVDNITPLDDRIIYSTERACYPYPAWAEKHPEALTPWRYLNGGGWMGPVDLLLEYWQRYGLASYNDQRTEYAQAAQQQAFFQAHADGFPVELDTRCIWFQTLAFAEPDDFKILTGGGFGEYVVEAAPAFWNQVTDMFPSLLHGNGRTDMEWIYKAFDYD